MTKYLLGDTWFRTKDEVKRKIHEMLYSYQLGERTSIEDTAILRDLLEQHPRAEAKIGCGIAAFEVRQPPQCRGLPNQRCFYLIRKDGTSDDFSYLKCISPPTKRTVFRSICRRLVALDVALFKDSYFTQHAREDDRIQCPITGERVSYEDAHVDHAYPDTFENLVRAFVELHGIDENTVELQQIGVVGPTFKDDYLRKSWVAYHKLHAKLRVVSAYANTHILPQEARRMQAEAVPML